MPGEGMDARAGDRGDVDDRPLRALQLRAEAAREQDGGEEIDLEHLQPVRELGLEQPEARAAGTFRRNRGIVDERVQPAALQALAHLADGALGILDVGEIDLQVILRTGAPGTVLGKRMARTGDDAPSRRREPFDRRMADPARGAGEQHGSRGRCGIGGRRHREGPAPKVTMASRIAQRRRRRTGAKSPPIGTRLSA